MTECILLLTGRYARFAFMFDLASIFYETTFLSLAMQNLRLTMEKIEICMIVRSVAFFTLLLAGRATSEDIEGKESSPADTHGTRTNQSEDESITELHLRRVRADIRPCRVASTLLRDLSELGAFRAFSAPETVALRATAGIL